MVMLAAGPENPNLINSTANKRALIEGQAALIVIDIQQSTFVEKDVRSIPHMPDCAECMARSRQVIDAASAADIPVIFSQEITAPILLILAASWTGTKIFTVSTATPKPTLHAMCLAFAPVTI